MGEDQGQVGAAVDTEKTPEQLRREIDDARRDLGDTAAALSAKTDVKSRAREKVESVKQTVSEKKESLGSGDGEPSSQIGAAAQQAKTKAQENPVPAAALAAFVGGFIFGRITRR